MKIGWGTRRWVTRGTVAAVTVTLWWAATTPSGFSAIELLMFTAPGAVLAIAGSWTSHIYRRGTWGWRPAARTAAIGALMLPPVLAFGVAFFSAMSGGAVVITFVLGAWLALGLGLIVGGVKSLFIDVRPATLTPSRPAHHAKRTTDND